MKLTGSVGGREPPWLPWQPQRGELRAAWAPLRSWKVDSNFSVKWLREGKAVSVLSILQRGHWEHGGGWGEADRQVPSLLGALPGTSSSHIRILSCNSPGLPQVHLLLTEEVPCAILLAERFLPGFGL